MHQTLIRAKSELTNLPAKQKRTSDQVNVYFEIGLIIKLQIGHMILFVANAEVRPGTTWCSYSYHTLILYVLVIHHHRTVDLQPTQLMVEEALPGLNLKLGLAVYFFYLRGLVLTF